MGKLDDFIICLIGKSGSGKSTIAKTLSNKYGYEILVSYSTRDKRNDNDNDHIFISEDEYEALENKVATTFFNGHHYCATKEQVDNCDLYIIDLAGLKQLKELYYTYGGKKKIISIYIDVPMEECLERMRGRGDSEDACWSRLRHDDGAFKGVLGEIDHAINGISNYTWFEVENLIEIHNKREGN